MGDSEAKPGPGRRHWQARAPGWGKPRLKARSNLNLSEPYPGPAETTEPAARDY